jgi:hypothetical protein
MAISYPLAAPAWFAKQAMLTPRLRHATAVSVSPFTGQQQVYSWPLQMWMAEVEFAPATRAAGEAVEAFLIALRGRLGTFTMGPRHATGPRGTCNTSGVTVSGAGQTGRALTIAGMGASRTLLPGDWLQLGSGATARLYRAVEDATANGSGVGTVSIEPALRTSPGDGDTVVVASPVGLWRLTQDEVGATIERGVMWRIPTLLLSEAL